MAGVDYGKILKRLQKGDNDQLVEEIHGTAMSIKMNLPRLAISALSC